MGELGEIQVPGDEFVGPGGIKFKVVRWSMKQDSEGGDELKIEAVRSDIYDRMYPSA